MSTINYIHRTQKLSTGLVKRISEGLVRIEDILHDRKIYGDITPTERETIKSMVKESVRTGLSVDDSVISLGEYFRQSNYKLTEYTAMVPGAATTANANVAPATSPAMTNKPIDTKGIEAMAQMLKNAGLTPQQLSQVTNKARQGM